MNDKQIYMLGMFTQGFIEALGMISENMQRQHQGKSMAYTEEDFQRVINQYGIHHNDILTQLSGY
jgi:hypothetical protein